MQQLLVEKGDDDNGGREQQHGEIDGDVKGTWVSLIIICCAWGVEAGGFFFCGKLMFRSIAIRSNTPSLFLIGASSFWRVIAMI